MCCVNWRWLILDIVGVCYTYLIKTTCLAFTTRYYPSPPRSGRDVMKGVGLHCVRGGLPRHNLPSPTNKSHLHVNRAVTLFRAPGCAVVAAQ